MFFEIVASSAFEASTTVVRCCFRECRTDRCDRSPLTSRLSGFDPLALVLVLTGSPTSPPSSNSESFIRARLSEGPTNSFPGYLRIASGPEGYPPLLLSLTSFPSCLEEWAVAPCSNSDSYYTCSKYCFVLKVNKKQRGVILCSLLFIFISLL